MRDYANLNREHDDLLKARKVTVEVEITLSNKYDLDVYNDGVGGLADIIRDGLNNPAYDYLSDIKIKAGTIQEQTNSFPCVECGEVYTEESGAYEGFVCDICIAKQSEQTLKIIDHDFVDANTLCVLVKDTKTGETFNGLLIKEE
jgi:hypothetical protein